MTRYRKKPVEVDAWRVGHEVSPEWARNEHRIERYRNGEVVVKNKYGGIKAYCNDYVVKDGGQFYVIHEDEFLQTYEAVNDAED